MRFGIKTNPQHTEWDRLVEMWEKADEVDVIDSAWLFDHFYPLRGHANGPCLDSWTTLAALAQATSRLKVGSMVNAMPYRHPAVTAKDGRSA